MSANVSENYLANALKARLSNINGDFLKLAAEKIHIDSLDDDTTRRLAYYLTIVVDAMLGHGLHHNFEWTKETADSFINMYASLLRTTAEDMQRGVITHLPDNVSDQAYRKIEHYLKHGGTLSPKIQSIVNQAYRLYLQASDPRREQDVDTTTLAGLRATNPKVYGDRNSQTGDGERYDE